MIKIEPQRGCDEDRYRNEGDYCENISPGERPPPPGPRRRLRLPADLDVDGGCDRTVNSGYDRDRRGGDLAFQRAQLRVQVFGVGGGVGRQNVPAGRLTCRVNTRNRHSIGEPNRGW
ncbi:hypothetical protein AB0C29_39170 [Actinoplanes sp. NPDC048791]|uniref:hypothetical protein n=1 Tax=Actinoplanes sp. NPDC048791 TaxID=3154623 RepID=UPI0033CCC030